MTANLPQNQAQTQPANQADAKISDKEMNFRNLEAKYQRELAMERAERERLAKELQAKQQQAPKEDEEDDDDEPYVVKKKLKRELNKFGQQTRQETQSEIQKAVQTALHEERKQTWLKQNADFYEVLQHAEAFANHDPELAETILQMPEGFERQKLVYKNIKALGLHKPKQAEPSIQQKIDANRRSPYYQPSGVGAAPYAAAGDFSKTGQKNSYDKMQELKNRLRLV